MTKNFWTSFPDRETMINTTHQWHGGGDHEKLNHFDGKNLSWNKDKRTYKPEDFDYKYNNHGFRTIDFNENDSCDILTIGCSFTEGVGVPENHTWPFQLNTFFNNKKKIINLGIAAISADGMSRILYWALNTIKLRPKMVVGLYPDILRTELFLNNFRFKEDISKMLVYNPMSNSSTLGKQWENYIEGLSAKNSLHYFIKNIIFCNMLCKNTNTRFVWDTWEKFTCIENLVTDLEGSTEKLYKNNTLIDILTLIKKYAPAEVYESPILGLYDKSYGIFNKGIKPDPFYELPIIPIDVSRDYLHPNPNTYLTFAKELSLWLESLEK